MTEKQALSYAAAYCSKAERCEYDIRKKLSSFEIDSEITNKIIQRLKKEGFLNESRFCESFIKDKARFNKWGKNKITFELRKKQISEETIQSCFESLGLDQEFTDTLSKLLSVKSSSIKAKDKYERRIKLSRFALSKGYSYDEIQNCLNKLLGEDSENGNTF